MSHSPLARALLDCAFLRTVYWSLDEENRLRWMEQCLQEGNWSPEHESAYAGDVLAWPQIAASTQIRVRGDVTAATTAGLQNPGLGRWLRLMFSLGVPIGDEATFAAEIHAMARQRFYLLVTVEQQRLVDRMVTIVRNLEPALGALVMSRVREQRVMFHQRRGTV